MRYIIMLPVFTLFCIASLSGQMTEKSESGIFLLKNGKIETMGDGLLEADVLIVDNMIKEIHNDISHPGAQVIDCSGLIIYPGMIDGGTRLGLIEIGSISLTRDYYEHGKYTPHMQALTAINPHSVSIPVTRVNGITSVLSAPAGGLLPGTAALINLHGYTPQQMYAGFKAVVLDFPTSGRRGRWDRRSDDEISAGDKKALDELNEFWEKAVLHEELSGKDGASDDIDFNPQLEALHPVIRGKASLLIDVDKEKDILKAIEWVREKDIKVIFTGVREGFRVADSLAKYDIPVITGPVLDTPPRASDKFDVAYANAGIMHKAGVKVALKTEESENVRNLPYHAGFAAAYGMGRIEALRAVTIVPAEIFGVEDLYGSVEAGKVANLFVADGDPFETSTSIRHLFISGWKVPLESRHTLLYDEFIEREPGLEK